jgi:hypothetical protein
MHTTEGCFSTAHREHKRCQKEYANECATVRKVEEGRAAEGREEYAMSKIRFVSDVQFTQYGGYYLCSRSKVHIQVLISSRLKEAIERQDWSQVLSDDIEELQSLRELGFITEDYL